MCVCVYVCSYVYVCMFFLKGDNEFANRRISNTLGSRLSQTQLIIIFLIYH